MHRWTSRSAKTPGQTFAEADGNRTRQRTLAAGKYLGLERARVTFADGEKPSATVEGYGELTYEPFRDFTGAPTTLVKSAFGMSPDLGLGQGSGHVEAFGISFDSTWGETAEVEFAS